MSSYLEETMFFTVAICTRNRASSLARTLTSIAEAERESSMPQWEVMVVDNGSSDDTASVVAGFSDRLPIRLVREPKPGVANARNTAARSAEGHYLIWADDDVLVRKDWITAYLDAFRAWPTTVVFAGRIVPVLEEPTPAWFREALPLLALPLAERDFGDMPRALPAEMEFVPYSANAALVTAVQRQFPFDPRRGPGTRYSGEETEAFMAILKAGYEARWLPSAVVEHQIAVSRQTTAYIGHWFEQLGRTLVWSGQESLDGVKVRGVPVWLARRALRHELDYWRTRATLPPSIWVSRLIRRSFNRGLMQEALRRSRVGNSGSRSL